MKKDEKMDPNKKNQITPAKMFGIKSNKENNTNNKKSYDCFEQQKSCVNLSETLSGRHDHVNMLQGF